MGTSVTDGQKYESNSVRLTTPVSPFTADPVKPLDFAILV